MPKGKKAIKKIKKIFTKGSKARKQVKKALKDDKVSKKEIKKIRASGATKKQLQKVRKRADKSKALKIGKRVIEKTINEQLPEDFQTAEYLLEHGMIDIVVHRKELRETLSKVLSFLKK